MYEWSGATYPRRLQCTERFESSQFEGRSEYVEWIYVGQKMNVINPDCLCF